MTPGETGSDRAILEVIGLTVAYRTPSGPIKAVDSFSLRIERGQICGIVGESGSGKSTVARAIIRLVPASGQILAGSILYQGVDLMTMSDDYLRKVRGAKIAIISQDPLTALNPVISIETQIGEPVRHHEGVSGPELRARVLEMMDLVGIPDARRRLGAYPHELSGGLRQRVAIAAALITTPDVLLADEPTTALDVTVQDQILRLLLSLRERIGMAVVLVTHDIGVVAQTCDRVAVMYAGRVVESGDVEGVLTRSGHPYTEALIGSIPKLKSTGTRLVPIPGSPPELGDLPTGCPFHPRCGYKTSACIDDRPELVEHAPGHLSACFHHGLVGRASS